MNTTDAHTPEPNADPAPSGVAVIGSGLIGASIGLALRAHGYNKPIVGTARRDETRAAARELGCFDDVMSTTAQAASAIGEAGLVVVCVPLGAFGRVFCELQEAEAETLTLTDAGSTKASVIEQARTHLYMPHRFVPAHPMAGSEKSGPAAGDAQLFVGKPCILTPLDDNPTDAVARTRWLWETLGMVMLEMSAREHDEQSAVVSHLPHAAAVLLTQIAMQRGGMDMASTGFRDTTRLASSNPAMRRDIMLANRDALTGALKALRDAAGEMIETIDKQDGEALLDTLEAARAFRDEWAQQLNSPPTDSQE